ncbi:SpoIIE family protein phosphatase, partial [Methylobacterium oryzihabitans]
GPLRRGAAPAAPVPPRAGDGEAILAPGALRGAGRGRDLDRLSRTLFLRIYPVIGAVVLLTQVAVAWVNYGDQIRLYGERAALTAALTANAIAAAGAARQPDAARSQLHALSLDPAFRSATLRDGAGAVVASLGEPPRGRSFELVQVAVPVAQAGGPPGQLTVVLSAEALRAGAENQFLIALAACLVLMLAVVVTLDATMRRHVIAPLRRLNAAMREVEHKRWTTVDLGGGARAGNEIDAIASAFNRMVEGLRSGDEARHLLAELERAHARLARANALVLESIGYARRIQDSVLPDRAALAPAGIEVAVLWEPLQVVGGDSFWIEDLDGTSILLVADCTGHGVPGAFLTLIVATALDRILHDHGLRSPAAILAALDGMVRARLRQDRPGSDSDDGLDCAVCVLDRGAGTLRFAGAGLGLAVMAEGGITRIRGARRGLGYRLGARAPEPPADVAVPLAPGAAFYLMTDGVTDQMGGERRRLLGHSGVAAMLLRHGALPLDAQVRALEADLAAWRGDEPRRDDMTLLAFRPRG